jgi:hypothetical protein
VAARQDDALGAKLAHEGVADVVRVDLAVDMRLAHAARDQLRDLGAEVEDQDLVVHGIRRQGPRPVGGAAVARKWRMATRPPGLQQRRRRRRAAPMQPVARGRCDTRPSSGGPDHRRQHAIRLFRRPRRPWSGPGLALVGGVGHQALHRRLGAAAEQVADHDDDTSSSPAWPGPKPR